MKDIHEWLEQKHKIQLIIKLNITNSEFVLKNVFRLCFDVYQKLIGNNWQTSDYETL
jgi:hypothetical protein